jgi:tetratricopeptide (TPR) repeat protein
MLVKRAHEGDLRAAERLAKEAEKLAAKLRAGADKARLAFIKRLKRVKDQINLNPLKGRTGAEEALREALLVGGPCEVVQAWGVFAYAQRAQKELDDAEQSLAQAWALAGDCADCLAYLHHRRARLRAAQRRYREGLIDAGFSEDHYRRFGPGHDLDGEGLANSLEARGQILYFLGRKEEAAEVFAECVRILPPRKEDLYAYAVVNLGVALRGLGPERKQDALDSLALARNRFRSVTEASVPRVKLDWLEGDLRCELKDRPDRGRELLYRALGDCPGLGLEAEGLAIASDLTLFLFPVRARILRMLEDFRPSMERLLRTPKLRRGFDEIYQAADACGWHAEERLRRTIAEVRRSVSGLPGVFPCPVS